MVLVAAAGAINWDVTLFVERIPCRGEEAGVIRISEVPGGKAANVAVAAARILGAGSSAIIGAIGDDYIGRRQILEFEREGVDVRGLLTLRGEGSGRAFVIVERDGGENVIFSYHGAVSKLGRMHLEEEGLRAVLDELKVLVIMDVPPEFLEGLMEEADEAGKTIILAPGVRTDPILIRRLAVLSDYLIINEHELIVLTGGGSLEAALGGRYTKVVVTLGADGAILKGSEGELRVPGVRLDSMGLRVENTVGCGDAFIGVFSSYKVMGYEDELAIRMANLAGAFKATRMETRGSPTRAELEEFERKAVEEGAFG